MIEDNKVVYIKTGECRDTFHRSVIITLSKDSDVEYVYGVRRLILWFLW